MTTEAIYYADDGGRTYAANHVITAFERMNGVDPHQARCGLLLGIKAALAEAFRQGWAERNAKHGQLESDS